MGIFPSVWDLILPNFNIWTIIGIILIIFGVLVIKYGFFISWTGINVTKATMTLFTAGILMIWGISIIEDFLSSKGGALIFWLSILTTLIAILLFWKPKKKK